jgi:hypothetical protein
MKERYGFPGEFHIWDIYYYSRNGTCHLHSVDHGWEGTAAAVNTQEAQSNEQLWAHPSTSELTMMSAQTGGNHLLPNKTKPCPYHQF